MGASIVPGMGTLRAAPLLSVSGLISAPFLSLQVLVIINCQSPHVIQGGSEGALGEVVGKSRLLFQGAIREIRVECWCGVSGDCWGRGKVRTGEEDLLQESEKGNEGLPSAS